MTYTYCINLDEVIIRHQKLLQTSRELPTVALSYHVKIRYECFMENKNITFCCCKLSKNNIKPDQNFTYKKHGSSGLRHTEYQKQKKVNKLWQKIIGTT